MQQGCGGKDLKQQSTWCFHVNHHLMTRHVHGKIRFQRTDREKACKQRNHEPCKNTETGGTKVFRSTVNSHEIFLGYLGTYDFQETFRVFSKPIQIDLYFLFDRAIDLSTQFTDVVELCHVFRGITVRQKYKGFETVIARDDVRDFV